MSRKRTKTSAELIRDVHPSMRLSLVVAVLAVLLAPSLEKRLQSAALLLALAAATIWVLQLVEGIAERAEAYVS